MDGFAVGGCFVGSRTGVSVAGSETKLAGTTAASAGTDSGSITVGGAMLNSGDSSPIGALWFWLTAHTVVADPALNITAAAQMK